MLQRRGGQTRIFAARLDPEGRVSDITLGQSDLRPRDATSQFAAAMSQTFDLLPANGPRMTLQLATSAGERHVERTDRWGRGPSSARRRPRPPGEQAAHARSRLP